MDPHRRGQRFFLRRIQVAFQNGLRTANSLPVQKRSDERPLSGLSTNRPYSARKKCDTPLAALLIVKVDEQTRAYHRVIAATTRQFVKHPALGRSDRRHMQRHEQLTRFERGLIKVDEELVGRNAPYPCAADNF